MQTPTSSTMPQHFRSLGFFFFLSGAAFHCMDFLGVEQTIEWGSGLFFLAAIVLTVIYWARFTIKKRVWKYII
jgi:hypothetical protein